MTTSTTHRARPLVVAALCGLVAVATALPAGAEPAISGPHALPANVGGNVNNSAPYGSEWCADSTDCTLVGPGGLSEGHATVLTETSGTWGTPAAVTLPANATSAAHGGFSFLEALSCWSVGNCVAVGGYAVTLGTGLDASPEPEPMAVDEIGGTWQTAQEITLPSSANLQFGALDEVSCDATGDCTGIGFNEGIDQSTLATTASLIVTTQAMGDTTWTASATLPAPSGSNFLDLPTALSCSGATTCTAIAYGVNASDIVYRSEFLSESSGTWSSVGTVGSVGGVIAGLDAMSCPSAGDCLAVGSTTTGVRQPVVDSESDGTWGAPRALPLPLLAPVSDEGDLNGVSCLTTTECVAVGDAESAKGGGNVVGLIEATTGAGWSATYDEAPIKTGSSLATVVQLGGVQCFSLTDCLTLGVAGLGSYSDTTHVNGFWSTISATESLTLAGKPSHLVITPGKTSTKVAFSPPTSDGGSKILDFTVTAKSKGEATRSCVTPGLSCTFKGAVKGKVYSVTVTARTKVGTSPPSVAKTFVAA